MDKRPIRAARVASARKGLLCEQVREQQRPAGTKHTQQFRARRLRLTEGVDALHDRAVAAFILERQRLCRTVKDGQPRRAAEPDAVSIRLDTGGAEAMRGQLREQNACAAADLDDLLAGRQIRKQQIRRAGAQLSGMAVR